MHPSSPRANFQRVNLFVFQECSKGLQDCESALHQPHINSASPLGVDGRWSDHRVCTPREEMRWWWCCRHCRKVWFRGISTWQHHWCYISLPSPLGESKRESVWELKNGATRILLLIHLFHRRDYFSRLRVSDLLPVNKMVTEGIRGFFV